MKDRGQAEVGDSEEQEGPGKEMRRQRHPKSA